MTQRPCVRRRWLFAALLGVVLAVSLSSPVRADPAGPTDYLSEIVSIEPTTPTIQAAILGGDSFFELTVDAGTEVFVLGYEGEDYLWFQPDGSVLENQNSPATYLNRDRYNDGPLLIPASATAEADPDWRQVGSDDHYAWHDHRAHWMQQARPFGRSPGDQILEAVIPLVVDDVEVGVTVISTWQPAASPVPMVLGLVAGLAVTAGAFVLRRRNAAPLAVLAPVAVLALVVGGWQFRSLPPETDPRLIWWVLPTIAVVTAVFGLVAERRFGRFVADAALLIVGVELAVWGFVKRDGFSAAIIPTDAPGWLDRFATALALVGGIGAIALAVWALFVAPQTVPRTAQRTGPQRSTSSASDGDVSGSTAATGSPPPVHP